MIFLIGLLLIVTLICEAQYPWIKDGESLTYGQCSSDSDCAIYVEIYPSQPASFFMCNQQIGRCQTTSGQILAPAFQAACLAMTFSSITYPSLDPSPARADGIIVINITNAPPPLALQGSLRLFLGSQTNVTTNITLTYPFIEEQFVNTPNVLYYFRNLITSQYTVMYFDKSGCISTYYPSPVTTAFNGVYFPVTTCVGFSCSGSGVQWNDATGFMELTAYGQTPADAAYGVGVRCGLNSPWSASYMYTNNVTDYGVGQRVPFAHIFDISGGVIFTDYGSDLLWPNPGGPIPSNPPFPLGGVNFPLNAGQIPSIFNQAVDASYLSGYVTIVFGIGYAYRDCPSCNLFFIQAADGRFEGYLNQPFTLYLANSQHFPYTFPPPAGTGRPTNDVGPMHFTLNGIFTNTVFMYQTSNIFAIPGNLSTVNTTFMQLYPTITIINAGTNQTVTTNSLCINATVNTGDVYMNFQPFPFTNNTLLFQMYSVTMATTGLSLTPFSPPETQAIVAMPILAQVYQPGFYCGVLIGNLLDGYNVRPLLQSCFQVGLAIAPLTQVRAQIQYSDEIHYPYTPFAGYTTNVTATFIVSLPFTLAMPYGLTPEVVLVRFSSDPNQQAQIDLFNGGVTDVFNSPLATLDLTLYYTVTNVGPFILYELAINPYSLQNQFVALFAAGSVVPQEFGYARIQILYTLPVPPLPPADRRRMVKKSQDSVWRQQDQDYGWNDENWVRKSITKHAPVRVVKGGSSRRLMSLNDTDSESPSFSQSQSQSQTQSQSKRNHGLDYDHENPEVLPFGISLQYECTLPVPITMIEYTQIIAAVTVTAGICPDTDALMVASTTGGFPFNMNGLGYSAPVYQGAYPPTTTSPPLTTPVAYDNIWLDVDTDTIILSGVGQNDAPVPQNQLIQLTSYDSVGASSSVLAMAVSVIPRSFVIITFLPQVPSCINGGTLQCVYMSFVLNNNNPQNIITIQPMDVTSRELYDPNQPIFDLPANCSLLQNYTAYQVYEYCVLGLPANQTLNCTYCTNLPIPYAQVINSNTIFTCVNQEWWTVTVWAITPFWNSVNQRFTYCQIENTISSHVPEPISFVFGSAQRIPAPPTCLDQTCFQAQMFPSIDPCYSDPTNTCYQTGAPNYLSQIIVISDPFLQPLNNNYLYKVNLLQNYLLTLFIGNVTFCPITQTYTPSLLGPLINEIVTTRTDCQAADASVTIFISYYNPSFSAAGTTALMCMYWPLRHDPSQATSDSIPLPFSMPVDGSTPTLLPNADFAPETQRFNGIRAGLQNILFYDRCPDNTCVSCLVPNTFTLNNPNLHYAYQQFTVDVLDNPAGGIEIIRNDYIPATCFGDTYYFNFSFLDSTPNGQPTQNYEVTFLYPFGIGTFTSFSNCLTGPNIMNDGQPHGAFQVEYGPFDIELPTGGIQGLGISGNYTFSVFGCTSKCTALFSTYINMVEPFNIILSTAGTNCAYDTTQLLPSVGGGTMFGPNDGVNITYMYPGSKLVYTSPYIFEWLTPFNPTNFTRTFLPLYVIPGNYTLRVIGPGPCSAEQSVEVTSPDPITASIVGYNKVCQTSNQSVIYLNVSGGTPPYRVLENITSFTDNNTIGIEFVLSYNNSHCVHIIDSSDCVDPELVCFTIPDPGPVNLTLTTYPSCYNVATGTVMATSPQPIQCSWSVTGSQQPLISSCTLTNLAPSAQLVLTATTIIGCVGQAKTQIGIRPPINLQLLQRTETGVPAGPCIDNITAIAFGGYLGPPYFISLFNDVTNASLTVTYEYMTNVTNSTGNLTEVAYILIQGVCRSYIYTILATEHDSLCLVTLPVNDPQFSFGSIVPGSTIPGLPPPGSFPPPPINPYFEPYISHGPPWWFIGVFMILISALLVYASMMATTSATRY